MTPQWVKYTSEDKKMNTREFLKKLRNKHVQEALIRINKGEVFTRDNIQEKLFLDETKAMEIYDFLIDLDVIKNQITIWLYRAG